MKMETDAMKDNYPDWEVQPDKYFINRKQQKPTISHEVLSGGCLLFRLTYKEPRTKSGDFA